MTEERYPGYNVLSKQYTPSWNEQTRRAINKRLAVPYGPRFFTAAEWQTLEAVCKRIVPQPKDRSPVPLPSYVDQKMLEGHEDGFRHASMPRQGEAWKRGLAALDEEARQRYGRRFHEIGAAAQDELLTKAQGGELSGPAWGGMPCKIFFEERVIPDVTRSYYAHPAAWNEIGWGGPASPRGYVRMGFDRRDPWEPAETKPGREEKARRENKHVGD